MKLAPWSPSDTRALSSGSLTIHAKRPSASGPSLKPRTPAALRADLQKASNTDKRQKATKSLTAAATRVGTASTYTNAPDRIRGAHRSNNALGWQEEVLAASVMVGELRYIANTTANAASRAWVFPVATEGTVAPSRDREQAGEDQEASERGAPDGTVDPEIIRRIVLLLTLIGEAYIVELPRGRGRPAGRVDSEGNLTTQGETHILAPMDIAFEGEGLQARVKIKRWGRSYPLHGAGRANVTRVHQPDARIADEPDSAARSALPVLRELIGLSMHVSATIDSRVAGAGIFYYPSDATVTRPAGPGGDTNPEFAEALAEAMLTPISQPDDASAVMPVLLGIPPGPDMKDSIGWLTSPHAQFDPNITAMRTENIRRLALTMDAPPEVLTGTKGVSGFGAWSIEGEFIRLQIAPKLRLAAVALTVAYGVEYTFDTSPLTVRPNLAVEAQALYDRGVISDTTLRKACGFSDEDAPSHDSPDDQALDMAMRLADESPSLLQHPGLPSVVDQCRIILGLQPKFQDYYPGGPSDTSSGAGTGEEIRQEAEDPNGTEVVNGREQPRSAPPSAAPKSNRPVSDRGPDRGSDGRPRNLPTSG